MSECGRGTATVAVSAPMRDGTYPIALAFAGDSSYAAAATSANLRVR